MTIEKFRLGDLRPGAEVGIDSRRTPSDPESVKSLAASIREVNGLLQPLGVWIGDAGVPYVAFGNRRLAALNQLMADGYMTADREIDATIIYGSRAEALAASLSENVERLALHPVDQYEDFAELIRLGSSIGGIADYFGLPIKVVQQRLALGGLAQPIREAWREGKLGAEAAQAFTLEPDQDRQVAVFRALAPQISSTAHHSQAYYIRKELVGDQDGSLARFLRFVGEVEYAAAGGRVSQDLFGEKAIIHDPDVLMDLAKKVLETHLKTLRDEGWGNVCTSFDMPENWFAMVLAGEELLTAEEQAQLDALRGMVGKDTWSDQQAIRSAARERSWTPELRAGAWAMATISHDGEVRFDRGRVLKEADSTDARQGKVVSSPPTGPGSEPRAVVDAMREWLSNALADLAAADPEAAVRIFVATALAGSRSGSPLCLLFQGAPGTDQDLEAMRVDVEEGQLADALQDLGPLDLDELIFRFVGPVLASAMDATTAARNSDGGFGKGVDQDGVDAILGAFGKGMVGGAIRARFDPVAYFGGSKKEDALRALRETFGDEAADRWAGKTKAAVSDHAARTVAAEGWLPAALRYPGYLNPIEAPTEPQAVSETPLADRAAAAEESVAKKRASRKAAAGGEG